MTITIELLRDDALDLIHQLEKLSILRVQKDKAVVQPKKNDITKLYGTLKLDMSVEEIDNDLKNLRNEWVRKFS